MDALQCPSPALPFYDIRHERITLPPLSSPSPTPLLDLASLSIASRCGSRRNTPCSPGLSYVKKEAFSWPSRNSSSSELSCGSNDSIHTPSPPLRRRTSSDASSCSSSESGSESEYFPSSLSEKFAYALHRHRASISSITSTPPLSRSPSPTLFTAPSTPEQRRSTNLHKAPNFKLVPAAAFDPESTPTSYEAIVFFPPSLGVTGLEATSSPFKTKRSERAMLLVGPAITKYLRGRSTEFAKHRMHPYRIIPLARK